MSTPTTVPPTSTHTKISHDTCILRIILNDAHHIYRFHSLPNHTDSPFHFLRLSALTRSWRVIIPTTVPADSTHYKTIQYSPFHFLRLLALTRSLRVIMPTTVPAESTTSRCRKPMPVKTCMHAYERVYVWHLT